MFREVIRNKKQILSQEKCVDIINKETAGVLSLLGDNDYTYGVPLSYAYTGNQIVFHGMNVGHKIDAMKSHNKVSFSIIETDQIVPEEYTSYFRSVIIFGKVEIVEDFEEKRKALLALVEKYSPNHISGGKEEIESVLKSVCVFAVNIEHISGKEAIELVKSK